MNNKNLIILLISIAIIALAITVFVSRERASNNYSVVYLTSGEIYVGRLSSFPNLVLRDAYIIQTVKDSVDPTKSNFQLTPLSETIWSPQLLYLNPSQVIFSGPMNDTSQAVEAIKKQNLTPK